MVNKSRFNWDTYQETPIIGIIRDLDKDTILKIASVYQEAGFSTLEVTMNTYEATDIISVLRQKFPTLNIGAGTVCSMHDFDDAINAGSQFIVTPIIDDKVIKKAVKLEIPIFPGAFSPTEIYKAWSLGASAVKVFPATQLGVGYIKDILGPLNQIKLVPTGGVSINNIKLFFEAGAFGVGMGSSLFNKKMILEKNFENLKKHFIKIKDEVKNS